MRIWGVRGAKIFLWWPDDCEVRYKLVGDVGRKKKRFTNEKLRGTSIQQQKIQKTILLLQIPIPILQKKKVLQVQKKVLQAQFSMVPLL